MSNVIARADLTARINAAEFGVPIKWPNQPFDRPDPPAPFLAVEMQGGESVPIELMSGAWQSNGLSWVHVMVPTNSGTDTSDALVDKAIECFRGAPLEPVVYLSASADPGGAGSEDGAYWRTSVSAEWRLQTYVSRGP